MLNSCVFVVFSLWVSLVKVGCVYTDLFLAKTVKCTNAYFIRLVRTIYTSTYSQVISLFYSLKSILPTQSTGPINITTKFNYIIIN
jgi:hypothetical protein